MVQVRISEEQKVICQKFARHYTSSVQRKYSQRGQNKPEIIQDQVFWAKLAELAVEEELIRLEMKIIEGVDLSIYPGNRKNFDADIITDEARFHIKSVQHNRHEKSWVFQKEDPVVYQPEDDEIIVLCITYPDSVDILGGCFATEAKKYYAPTRKDFSSKEALYLKNNPNKSPAVPEVQKILKPLNEIIQILRII